MGKRTGKTATLTVRIPEDMKAEIDKLADDTGLSQRFVTEQLLGIALGHDPMPAGVVKLNKLLGEK